MDATATGQKDEVAQAPPRRRLRVVGVGSPSLSRVTQPVRVPSTSLSRVTEVQARLRILSERDSSKWGVSEMKAALAAGGATIEGVVLLPSKEELRRRTQALAKITQAQEAEAAAAAEAAIEGSRMAVIFRKGFRSRGARATQPAGDKNAPGDETHRGDVSDSSDDDEPVCMHKDEAAWRDSFRSRGALRRRAPPPAEHPAIDGHRELLSTVLLAALVPEFAAGTLWASSVEAMARCLVAARPPAGPSL